MLCSSETQGNVHYFPPAVCGHLWRWGTVALGGPAWANALVAPDSMSLQGSEAQGRKTGWDDDWLEGLMELGLSFPNLWPAWDCLHIDDFAICRVQTHVFIPSLWMFLCRLLPTIHVQSCWGNNSFAPLFHDRSILPKLNDQSADSMVNIISNLMSVLLTFAVMEN